MSDTKREIIEQYIPATAVEEILNYQENFNFKLIITRPRKSKLGDFKPISRRLSVITINGNLNKYEFLIVLLHEIAHLMVWKKYFRRKKPHGIEWKNTFHDLVIYFINLNSFPKNIEIAATRCMSKKVLSTIKCEELARILKENTSDDRTIFLQDIPDNCEFILKQGKSFLKLHKIRTRYKCKDLATGRIYTVHPMAEVQWYKVV